MKASLRPRRFGVDRRAFAVHDVAVERVLDVRPTAALRAPDARAVRLVVGEERTAAAVGVEIARAEAILEGEAGHGPRVGRFEAVEV